ncbi:MAG: AraC family transcriptional regulator [Verrucomicrobiota bacterium]
MNALKLKEQFVSQIRHDLQWQQLFDHLPEVCFFVKDAESRLMAADSTVLERLGAKDEAELIGRPDTDFFPEEIARGYVADDQMVIQSGKPLIHRMEVWKSEGLNLQWCLTTKYPLFNNAGEVIGIMGTTQPRGGDGASFVHSPRVARAISFIEEHYAEPVRVEPLAAELNMSSRQLNRAFLREVGVSVRVFHTRARVVAAANQLLESHDPVGDIALDTGFCDQSALSRAFRKQMGCSPGEFRRRSQNFG